LIESDHGPEVAESLARRLEGSNINPQTCLATDYLNHFNEVVMIFGMLGDMPEMFDDIKVWEPKSYVRHFSDSNFSDRDLAIEAYEAAPGRFRIPFDSTIDQLNQQVAVAIVRITQALVEDRLDDVGLIGQATSRIMQKLIDVASGIIHGSEKGMSQADIDAFMGTP